MKRIWLGTLLLVGCTGGGSDIGPDIPLLPDASYRVLLRHPDETDSNPLGVSSAVVSIGDRASGTSLRSGRADLALRPTGTTVVTIDPTHGSALVGDQLVGYSIAVDAPGLDEVPFVCYVPDVSTSNGLVVTPGLQGGSTLDDSGNSGAVVTIANGATVGTGAAASVTVRTGALSVGQLPGRLPEPSSGAWLTTRAVWVGAPDFEVAAPGASLRLPNDLNSPGGASVAMFMLDPAAGQWVQVSTGTVDGGAANIDSAGGVTQSGLYCFAVVVNSTTVLSGRVLRDDCCVLDDVLVRVPQGFATSDGSGNFVLPAIAAVDGSGAARTIDIVCHGGRRLRAVRTSLSAGLIPGNQAVGDIMLETERVLQVRGMLVNRGRVDPRQRVALGSITRPNTLRGFAGDDGRFDFDDVEARRWISFLSTRIDPVDTRFVLSTEGARLLNLNERNFDTRWFFLRVPWISGINTGALTYVLDRRGGARIDDASIIRQIEVGRDAYVRATFDSRLDRIDYGIDGRATAAFENFVDGKRVISTFSARRARADRVELPLERALLRPLGKFARHGKYTGSVAEVGDTRLVRTTRRHDRRDWMDEVFRDESVLEVLPADVATPAGGLVGFTARVPADGGNLAVIAGTTTGPTFRLDHLWFAPSLSPAAGTSTAIDLGAGRAANVPFTVTGGATAIDAALTGSDFTLDLAIEFDDGRFVDLARDVGGNHTFGMDDVTLTLPALAGDLAGGRVLAALTGTATAANVTTTQRSLAEFDSTTTSATLHPVPTITSPAPNASVSLNAFTVDFTVPPGTTFLLLKLRQETTDANGDVVRDWTALLPPDDTSFEFRQHPSPAPSPLAAGAYTLTLTAARVETGPLTREEFQFERINARYVGLSWADFEVNAVSSVSIPVTLN